MPLPMNGESSAFRKELVSLGEGLAAGRRRGSNWRMAKQGFKCRPQGFNVLSTVPLEQQKVWGRGQREWQMRMCKRSTSTSIPARQDPNHGYQGPKGLTGVLHNPGEGGSEAHPPPLLGEQWAGRRRWSHKGGCHCA